MVKLIHPCHITKVTTVFIFLIHFKFFRIIKTLVVNYDFRLKVKIVIVVCGYDLKKKLSD